MFTKNSLIRTIAVISILALMTLVVLPGCSFIGKAELPEVSTTQDLFGADGGMIDVGNGTGDGTNNEDCCQYCGSTSFKGPDDRGYFTCNECGAQWAIGEQVIDIIKPDGSVITKPNVGNMGGSGSSGNGGSGSSGNGGSGSSGNGGSGSLTPPTTTTTTKSFQQQMDEIKDRWGDVIKPTIDADGNITVESKDGSDTGLFGFKYSTKDKCFIIAEDAWQRNFGYNKTYDDTSAAIAITYDTMRVYFEYDGLEWMIQYWKGQYGMILIGAEIGTYNRPVGSTASTHYNCASDELKMLQSMDVYRRESTTSNKFNKVFSRSPAFTWWCAGFIPGTLGAGKYNVTAEETAMLRVDSKLTLHTPEMAQAFMQGLREVTQVEYNGIERYKRGINMVEFSSVEEYVNATGTPCKFALEEDGVTVRVCWR